MKNLFQLFIINIKTSKLLLLGFTFIITSLSARAQGTLLNGVSAISVSPMETAYPTASAPQEISQIVYSFQISAGGTRVKFNNFQFNLTDVGVDWSNVIQDVFMHTEKNDGSRLDDVVSTGFSGTNNTTVLFTMDPANDKSGDIKDSETDVFEIRIRFKTSIGPSEKALIDGKNIQITISDTDFSNFDNGSINTNTISSTNVPVAVLASKLEFTSVPPLAKSSTNFSATLQAQDANGNLDLDNTAAITVSSSSGTPSSTTGLAQSLIAGTYTWNDLQITGTASFTLSAVDTPDNLTDATSSTINVDDSPPTVSDVSSIKANGTYGMGEIIDIQVLFNESVIVTGSPQITLETGTTDQILNYSSGSGSNTLVFNYTVQAGDVNADLDYISTSALALNGGTILDAAGNIAILTLASPGAANSLGNNKAIVIDGIVPVVASVTLPGNSTYVENDNVNFTVNFSENVTVAGGTPRIQITLNSGTVYANYLSGSGTSSLVFRYTVSLNDDDNNGITLVSPIDLNGATIQDVATNNADLVISTLGTGSILVDALAPTVSSLTLPPNATYITGNNMDFTANYNEIVTVAGGTPRIEITLNSGTVYANYLSGSGTSSLVFRYTVLTNNDDNNGITIVSPLDLNGATIQDAAANNADLVISTLGTGSILVDALAPTVSSLTLPGNTTYGIGDNLDFTVIFSENVVIAGGTPRIGITLNSGTVYANYFSGSSTSNIVFRYTVSATEEDNNGITLVSPIDLNGATIKDAATNNADLVISTLGTGSILVDGIVPTVSSLTLPSNTTYAIGSNLDFTANFSKTVNIAGGTPRLEITLNSGTVYANYLSGSGSSNIVFRYTVSASEEDNNGITLISPIDLNGATIQDGVTNNANLAISTAGTGSILVDGIVPTISSIILPPNATYGIGNNMDFTVNYNEVVSISGGSPRIQITLNSGTVYANYLSGSGTSSLVFRYTVSSSDEDNNGIAIISPIDLNGAIIQDASTNNANLVFSTAGTGSILVDGIVPTVSSIVRQTPTNASTNASSVTFRVTFSEAVNNVDLADFLKSGTATGTLFNVNAFSVSVYDVQMNTISGDGNLNLDFGANNIVDNAGNAFGGTISSEQEFIIDNTLPQATVSINTNPIYTGALTQTVTVLYNESMNNATSPTIVFGTSTNFVSNSDGVWSTTSFTNDTWTESFTHNGTAEEIGAETANVLNSSGATDVVGNTDLGDVSPNFLLDTKAPSILGTLTFSDNGGSRETISFTFDETINLIDGTEPLGFTSSTSSIRNSSKYNTAGNQVVLESNTNSGWSPSTTISYTNGSGNITDAAGNEMATVGPLVTTDNTPPVLITGMIFNPNGTGSEQIIFNLSEELNLLNGDIVYGFYVDGTEVDAIGAGTATYSSKGIDNTITLTSSADGIWNDGLPIDYIQGVGPISGQVSNVFDLSSNELIDITEPILLQAINIVSDNANTTQAKPADIITLTFMASAALDSDPTILINGLAPTTFDNSGAPSYTATLTTTGGQPEGLVPISITAVQGGITTVVTYTTDDPSTPSSVTFDETAPVITPVTIASNNPLNSGYANAGDIVSLNVTFDAPISSGTTVLAGQVNPPFTGGPLVYVFSHIMDGTEPEGLVTYNVTVGDAAGNQTILTATTDASTVIFDNTAPTVNITSTDADALVKQGDNPTITATFTDANAIDESTAPTISIGTLVTNAAMVKSSNLVWTYIWTIPAGNDGSFPISITATDIAGNAAGTHSGQTLFTIDNTAPTLLISKNAVTNGTDGIAGENSYTNDNSIAYTLIFDNPIDPATFTVADITVSQSSKSLATFNAIAGGNLTTGDNQTYTLVIPNTAGDGDLFFSIGNSINDIAGNARTEGPTNSDNFIIDNTAPTLGPDEISLFLNGVGDEDIAYGLSEELNLVDNAMFTGITTSPINFSTLTNYLWKGTRNTIQFSSDVDNDFTAATTVSFTNPGNITDLAGNLLPNFSAKPIAENLPILTAGDLMFTGYNSTTTDGFSFVLLKDIKSGTKINFTDRGWIGGTNGFVDHHNTGVIESDLQWTSTSDLFAGTEITVNASAGSASTGNVVGTLNLSATHGDQVLAYNGPVYFAEFISAINMDYDAGNYDPITGWSLNTSNSATDDENSVLPNGLTGNFALPATNDQITFGNTLGGATDAQYNGTNPGSTLAALRTALADPVNWNTQNGDYALTSGDNYTLKPDVTALAPVHTSTVNTASLSALNGILLTFDDSPITKEIDIFLYGTRLINIIKQGSGTVLTYDINNNKIVENGNNSITLNIASDIAAQGDGIYEIHVDGYMFKNNEGLHNTPINGNANWTFTYDGTPPTINSIQLASGNPHNAGINAGSVNFSVEFSENVSGVDISDFTLSTSNLIGTPTIASVNASTGTTIIITVNGFDLDNTKASGSINLNIVGGASILDDAGNNTTGVVTGVDETYTIINPEPAQDIALLTGTAQATTIDLSWANSVVDQIAYQHLILVKESGSLPNPTDGAFLTDDLDLSSGTVGQMVINVAPGISSYTLTELNSANSYDFEIYPYTNNGVNVNYKTTTPASLTLQTTTASETSISFTSASPTVSSLSTTVGTATASFIFTVKEDGLVDLADNSPTLITNLVFTQGPSNDPLFADWTTIIEGARLIDDAGSTPIDITPGSTSLTFALPADKNTPTDIGHIIDNGSKIYTLQIWVTNPLILGADSKGLEFVLESANVTVNNTDGTDIADGTGTTPVFVSINSGAANNKIDITATKFIFTQQPSSIEGINIPWTTDPVSPTIEARDANENLDTGYSNSYSITTPSAGLTAPLPPFNLGVLDLTNLAYASVGDGTLTISATGVSSGSSDPVQVVHTQALQLTNGIQDNSIPLISGKANVPIFGIQLDGQNAQVGEPNFNSLIISFKNIDGIPIDVNNIFDGFRLFRSSDNSIDPTLSGTTNISSGIIDAGGQFVTFNGFSEELDGDLANQYFFVVANVSVDADELTPPTTPFMNTTDIFVSSGSALLIGGTDGLAYTFSDTRAPKLDFSQLVPQDNDIIVDINTAFEVVFDESVFSMDNVITLRKQGVDEATFSPKLTLDSYGSSNRSAVFKYYDIDGITELPLEPEKNYYITIAPGNISNSTGFRDESTNQNLFEGISNNTTWNFRTADITPPIMSSIIIDNIDDQGFSFGIDLDERGSVYYLVVDPTVGSFTAPTVSDLFNQNTSVDGYLGIKGVYSVVLPNEQHVNFVSNLSQNQNFAVYAIAEDQGLVKMTSPQFSSTNQTDGSTSSADLIVPTLPICEGDTQPMISPLFIREGTNGDFSDGTKTITLAISSLDFEFNPSAILNFGGSSIGLSNFTTEFISNTVVKIDFDVSSTINQRDYLSVAGFEFISINGSATAEVIKVAGSSDFDSFTSAFLNLESFNSSTTASFEFIPNVSSIGNDQLPILIDPDPTLILGTNTFSGNGVFLDIEDNQYKFNPATAGNTTHTIRLEHKDIFGCAAFAEEPITVFDAKNAITSLDDKYCVVPGDPTAVISISSTSQQGLVLVDLSINTDDLSGSIEGASKANIDPGVLVKEGNDYNFFYGLAAVDSVDQSSVALQFIGIYTNELDASDTVVLKKVVSISDNPTISSFGTSANNLSGSFLDYCENDAIITLTASIDRTIHLNTIDTIRMVNYNGSNFIGIDDQSSLDDNNAGVATLDPLKIKSIFGNGSYIYQYLVTNTNTTCSNSDTLSININPKPIANFSILGKSTLDFDGCVDEILGFQNNTDIITATSSFVWSFDDDNAGAGNKNNSTTTGGDSPNHFFATNGNYNVSLQATTDKGCISDVTTNAISIGNNPVTSFTYSQIAVGTPTLFTNTTPSDANATLDSIAWSMDDVFTFGDNTNLNDVYEYPDFTAGTHKVTLTAITDKNCTVSKSLDIFVVPEFTLSETNAYDENFDGAANSADEAGWIAWGTKSSWGVGNSGGDKIQPVGNSNFWVTGVDALYNDNETSYVYSPVFDISELDRPMVQLLKFADLSSGVVIEYTSEDLSGSTKFGIDSSKWQLLGTLESGDKWYNAQGIETLGGNVQPIGQFGWSGSDAIENPDSVQFQWKTTKHILDDAKAASADGRIQLRIAFKSSETNLGNFNGFAFDDIFIGNRTRTVLLENFTNSQIKDDGKTIFENDSIVKLQNTNATLAVINYHINSGGIANKIATTPYGDARALYYGISNTPRVSIDGTAEPNLFFSEWGPTAINVQSLNRSPLLMETKISPNGSSYDIITNITATINGIDANYIVHTVIVENEVIEAVATETGEKEFRYVARKMLPSASGKQPKEQLIKGESISVTNTWSPSKVYNANALSVIVFVQDEDTREIYQAEIKPIDINIITSLSEELSSNGFAIWPNPANDAIFLQLSNPVAKNTKVTVFDQVGKIIHTTELSAGNDKLGLNSLSWTPGMYYIQTELEDRIIQKRILVQHK